jgi:hypothetical protein
MATRFSPGDIVIAKDGRRYTVDDLADGIVYCSSESGAEVEFGEAQLQSEAEWSAKTDGRRDQVYVRLKQAKPFTQAPGRLDPDAAATLVRKVERLLPGIQDFAAYRTADALLDEWGQREIGVELSTVKCRDIFDAAPPDVKLGLLARLFDMKPEILLNAAGLGDNLLRAMIEKGMAAQAAAYEAFLDRPRR